MEELFAHPLHPYTQALLEAIPVPEIRKDRQETTLQGEVVSPINLPDECRFCKRCPLCEEQCRRGVPSLREVRPGHFVACCKV